MENKVREMEGFVEILAKKREEVLGIMAHNHRTGKVLKSFYYNGIINNIENVLCAILMHLDRNVILIVLY